MLWGGYFKTALLSALLLSFLLISTTFISCAGGAGSPKGSDSEETSLAIKLPDTAKTLYEKNDIVTFTVTISSGSYNSTKTASKGETMRFSNIPAGTYSVTAYGKIANGSIAAKCVTSVKIVSGETTTTTLHLSRLDYYVVTFKDEETGAELYAPQNVTTGYTVPKPADPTKTGSDFSFWANATSLSTSFDFNTPITADTNLVARFEVKHYTITFNYNGGSVGTASSTTQSVEYNYRPNTSSAVLATPSRTAPDGSDYTFKGWNETSDAEDILAELYPATADKTYYAVWEPKVKVTFDYNGGTNSGNTKKEVYPNKDSAPDVPAASEEPAWANHKFKGWASSSSATTADNTVSTTPVSADTTYYAVWLPAYNITYTSGTNGPAIDTTSTTFSGKLSYTSDEALTLPRPSETEYPGYTFVDWYTDAAFTPANKVTAIAEGTTGNVTLYAKWTVAVHMSPDNGTDAATTYNVVYNKSFNDSVPDVIPESMANDLTKTGATFGGWYKTSSAVPPTTWPSTAFDKTAPITEEIYLHAKWNATVTFDSQGGSAVTAQTVACGEKATVPTVPTNSSGLSLLGWYTSTDGGTTLSSDAFDFDTEITENITLYAKWGLDISGLSSYLTSLPAGSVDAPNVLPAIAGLTTSNWTDIKTALTANSTKYVDLSATALPEGITSMNEGFKRCGRLVAAPAIPDGVTDMSSCFYECGSLTASPVIPESVTNMSDCFLRCGSLTEPPAIPDAVTNMNSCFSGCRNLTTAPVIPNGVTNMHYCFYSCELITTAPAIPDGVTDMSYCFSGCSSLTAAPAIPDSVTNMYSCFYECSSLTAAPAIPSGVTDMRYCFEDCSSLTGEIVINAEITDSSKWRQTFLGVTSSVTVKVKSDAVINSITESATTGSYIYTLYPIVTLQ